MPPYDEYSSLWEGNSPNAAHAYERMKAARQAPDNSWLERLFSRRQSPAITSQPLPPMNPTDEGRFPPSPFAPPPASPKAVSKLSSASDIAKRISGMISTVNEPPPVSNADFGLPPSEYRQPQSDDPLARAMSQIPNAEEPPPPRVPINMRDEPSPASPVMAAIMNLPAAARDVVLDAIGRTGQSGNSPFGNNRFGGTTHGGNTFGGNRFGGNRFGASAGPGETGGYPMIESPSHDANSIFPPTSDVSRGYMVREDESMREMQRLLKMAQMFERQGTSETGGTPVYAPPASPASRLFGGNRFGGNTFGGNRFGASAKAPLPYDLPYAHGGSIPGYAEGGFEDNLPHMMGLLKQVVENHPQVAMPPPSIPSFAPPAGGDGGGGGSGGFGGLVSTAMSFLPMFLGEGGNVPGFMRGGYPELYNAPVRHFDSGGASYVGGGGDSDGRADNVSARLSPKEYVMDAETMSMLGDGNPDHGAMKMDQFRANVRKHKGKALAKGKFSPNAKNPMEYLASNPMGDGMRRLGTKS